MRSSIKKLAVPNAEFGIPNAEFNKVEKKNHPMRNTDCGSTNAQ